MASILLKVVSMIMLIIFAISILLLILTYRKPKKVSLHSLAITLGVSLLSLVIFSAIIGYSPSFWLWLLMAIAGGAIGYFWARTTKVYLEKNQVKSQNSIWYLVVWGAVFFLNQLIIITTNRPPAIAMAMLIMSTFIVWGTAGSIIQRYFRLQPALAPQVAGTPAGTVNMPTANAGPNLQQHSTASFPPSRQAVSPSPPPALPGPFAVVASSYSKLKAEYDNGVISSTAFMDGLNLLRLQDDQGNWWQIGEDGQSWLKWDGTAWIKTEPRSIKSIF